MPHSLAPIMGTPEMTGWHRPTVVLALCCTMLLVSGTPFPKDLEPINTVGGQVSFLHPVFQGLNPDNDTLQLGLDFQRMIRIHHMLYIAARDHVFAINLSTSADEITPQYKLTWKTKPQDMEKCALRGKNNDECYNYIKVLVSRNDQTLFACGTNAFNPTCRNYKMETLEQDGEELLGQARCPFESKQSNVALFADGNLYSATMADFLASDAVIYRSLGERSPVLRTVKYDSKWLREPHFHHAIEYGRYVYFFFSEIAVEYTTLGKVVYSRVARVCKNDMGGSPRVLEKYWTSFLKARLNCSIPGDSFFYFDVLQSVSNVVQVNMRPAVIGVFTTQSNSITGSGVCAFYMDDIEKVFSGKFKEQKTTESIWSPVPDERVPKPRPGSCAGEESAASYKSSNTFPDETLSFIKSYPLMDDAVPSVSEKPWFTKTTSRYKLNQIAVDTEAGPDKNYTVVFLGSEDGKILKVLASTAENSTRGSLLLEEVDVYNPSKCNKHLEDRRILGLELDKEHHALFAAFSSCVIRVPLSRCQNYGRCKKTCLRSQDPYCIWLKSGTCANLPPGFKGSFEQDIENGYSQSPDSCHDILATPRNQNPLGDPSYGVRRQPEADKSSQSVHFTLLIACVVVAFALGAFLSGLLVSCYCSHVSHKTKKLNKEPEATIPHALSLRSLAKLNGLLDGPGRDEKMEVSSPKLYHTLISNVKEQQVNGNTRASSGNGKGDSHHVPELSGLPTPESTPELPVKSMKAFRNQWEKNQNCNNAKDVRNPIMTGSRPNSGVPVQVFQFPNSLALSSSGQVLGGSSHLHLEDRKIPNVERIKTQAYSCYPQKMVDVNTLDELLKHLHEANMSNSAGKSITMINAPQLTNNGQIPFANRVQPKIPDTESAPYYSSSTLPRDSLTRRLDVPPDMPPPQSTLERSSRHPSQRHSMCSAPKMINGCIVSRQHSFNHRSGQPPPPLLARMNSTGSTSDSHRPFHPNGYLSRQHSYNEQEAVPRGGIVRRTCSLKPDVPPKPMFIPATSPVNSSNQFNY
ncbi:sema domain, transmembrane domain (TM), and cytoplasmic domain, (semaphorin) 6E isoform X2 [Polypterus senegalus]|uniref:sema domain, transmembrane domain (TM), and cytoplasmic domain, (semaphorin) 6E isoform X2 n=1 Tax=Polypterus senegalus TaxID=55291 RepID=UPI001965B018|nr:sema domain, transmembrane domain (TM), and cytoplasmic domain, (semaphorin) 6E isoform X2 [Polypterus senegalus]